MGDLKMGTKQDYQKPGLEKLDENIIRQKLIDHLQLDQAEAYRLVIENTYEAIAVTQGQKICFCNNKASEISGYNQHELLSKNFIDLVHPEDRVTVIDNYSRKLKGEATPEAIPLRILTKDGAVKWVLGSAVKITWKGQPAVMGFIIDITERILIEEALRKSREELEHHVKDRTKELEIKAKNLEEVNTALKVLMKRLDEDKKILEEKVLFNVQQLVEPNLEKLKKSRLTERQKNLLDIIESNLNEIISPFAQRLSNSFMKLTPAEIQVANFIRQGKTTKEIAEMLNLSPKTVEFHRDNIRKKIGIKNKKINLRTHLLSIK
jgi:PAS domain S-box-containing protein